MPQLSQALHGYDSGHRLLASSGDLDDQELALLDRMSDLSGYLPPGLEFAQYHTGFPCGRFYALATTWPDSTAPRAGAVLTHTLLVPDEIEGFDLGSLAAVARQPADASDRTAYKSLVPLTELAGPPPALSEAKRRALAALYFAQTERPILWESEHGPDLAPVRWLWWRLQPWPDRKRNFAFCTLALQPRRISGRMFDYLQLAPASRSDFHAFARSPAWWRDGQVVSEKAQALLRQPLVAFITETEPGDSRRLQEQLGLKQPPPPKIYLASSASWNWRREQPHD